MNTQKNRLLLKGGKKLYRHLLLFVLNVLLLVGCNSTKTFDGGLDGIKADIFEVDCSDEVYKPVRGGVNSIGVNCTVKITEDTKLLDEKGKSLKTNDFPLQSHIKVVLTEPENMQKRKKDKQLNLVAKEIILLNQAGQ